MMRYSTQYWRDAEEVLHCVPNIEALWGKNLLITGAGGMICSTVVELLLHLNKRHSAGMTICLGGRSRERLAERFSIFREGVDYQFVPYNAVVSQPINASVDYIIHGASPASPTAYVKEPVQTMLANFVGLNNLLWQAVQVGVERLLYISSSEIYGSKQLKAAYQEGDYGFLDLLNPRACYPCAKRAAETLCASYSEEYGIDTVIVRPGHIYGPTITEKDDRASAQFTRSAVNHDTIVMKSAGRQLRSYCYTMDCASAILTVLLNGESRGAYNISNRDSVVSIRDVAEMLARLSNTQITYQKAADSEERGYNLMENSSLDAHKLEALGWRACFNLARGVGRTLMYLGAEDVKRERES